MNTAKSLLPQASQLLITVRTKRKALQREDSWPRGLVLQEISASREWKSKACPKLQEVPQTLAIRERGESFCSWDHRSSQNPNTNRTQEWQGPATPCKRSRRDELESNWKQLFGQNNYRLGKKAVFLHAGVTRPELSSELTIPLQPTVGRTVPKATCRHSSRQ